MLELRGVCKVYGRAAGGRVEALADLSFEVKPAELAVLVGPVGAGKSTLFRLVTGEERPTRGAVLVGGTEVGALGVRGLARLRRDLGVLPQDGHLLPDRTALGNLTFVLRALGTGRAEARERALAALVEVGLGSTRNALPHELAVGERRRVLLARALSTRPRLLLADEPTAMLDSAASAMVVTLLRSLPLRGTTCLVATQATEVARALDGRVLQLAAGRLRPEGDPV
jgi:ABC-type ATPase involved in cell division